MSGDEELDRLLAKVPMAPGAAGEHVDDGVLLAYREQRLEAAELERVEQHLAACSDCRALLVELSSPLPADLEEFGKSALAKRRRRPSSLLITAAAIAASIAAALIFTRTAPPEYEISGPRGGVQALRGTSGESQVFVPSSRFELAGASPTSMRVLVEDPDGSLHEAPAEGLIRGEGGTFRYELEASRLFGSAYGKRKIHVVFGGDHRREFEVEYRRSEEGQ